MSQEAKTVPPPQGDVTLLFTDVEGSTKAWERHADTFGEALQVHDRKLRAAILAHDGFLVKTAGDAFMAAFSSAHNAIQAALQMQQELASGENSVAWRAVGGIRVRIGLHTGRPAFRDNDYFGPPVNRAARICDAGHGGMILLSEATLRAAGMSLDPSLNIIDHELHRLKDLGEPEHLFEIRRDHLPPPSSDRLRTMAARKHNFPAHITALVGRQKELTELHALVSRREHRLITISGPGGIGKTRLALQVGADRLQDFAEGVWLIDLAETRDSSAVPTTIALALELELPPGANARQILKDYLRSRQTLLVLDNYEQVADSAVVISELLRECPDLFCLVTSRELLRVSGEAEYMVEPLSIPEAGAPHEPWANYGSVQLFAERCRAARPDFELTDENAPIIAEICRRLDGIPLAIELAAARLRGMAPAQILQRMSRMFDLLASGHRDLPERQRTLRSAIDWSYDLLNESERELFAELSVFAGSFTLETAEEVCTVPGAFFDVVSLRDKSLLKTTEVSGETRYSMLATIKEYAGQKLKEAGTGAEVFTRHSHYYQRHAAEWSAQLAGAEAPEAMRVFTLELDNIRSGMDWAAMNSHTELTVEYAKSMFAFLRRRGLFEECDARLAVGEAAAREAADDVSRARILNQRALVAYDMSDVAKARPLFQESYALSRELSDRARMLVSLMNLGNISWATSRFGEARREWEEALTHAIDTQQDRYEAYIRENLGILECQEGRTEEARVQFDVSLSLHRKVNNLEGLASALYNSSYVFRRRNEYEEALRRVLESRTLYASLQDQRGLALTSIRAGLIERQRGESESAVCYVEEGLNIAVTGKYRHAQMFALLEQARIYAQQGDSRAAETRLRQSFLIGQEVGDRKHMAEVTGELAIVRQIQGRQEEAVALYTLVSRIYSRLGFSDSDLRAEYRRLGQQVPDIDPDLYTDDEEMSDPDLDHTDAGGRGQEKSLEEYLDHVFDLSTDS